MNKDLIKHLSLTEHTGDYFAESYRWDLTIPGDRLLSDRHIPTSIY